VPLFRLSPGGGTLPFWQESNGKNSRSVRHDRDVSRTRAAVGPRASVPVKNLRRVRMRSEQMDRRSIIEHIPVCGATPRALVGDRYVADDLVQDTLERAWNKFYLWRPGSDLRAWAVYDHGITYS